MQFLSHDLLYFIRALAFGVVVYFALFYIFLYSKPIVENIFGVKKFDTDLWWGLSITIAVLAGLISAILLM